MVQLIKSSERHLSSQGWLKSYFLFSFADYYDPGNMQFGPLRVFNDDTIAARSGFPMHPHSDMEIVTIVVKGAISHKDSLGNEKTIKAGEVQRMTAGTGLTHSEHNDGDEELHLYQLWFLPNRKGLQPSYEQKEIGFLDSTNELIPLVTGQKVLEDVVYMNSNSTVYYANLQEEKEIDFKTSNIRKIFIYVTEGALFVNGQEVNKHDQLRLTDQELIKIKAAKTGSFVLIDVPAVEANY